MLTILKAADRGHANYGWLDTYHTFSFNTYYDEAHMGFRSLRVINEDVVQPGQGFGMHPHRDMEILTYVLSGSLEHKDSTGSGSIIAPGTVQHMSAGSGIRHSEFNPSDSEAVHLLQIWIEPAKLGVKPQYAEKDFPPMSNRGHLALIASPDGREESLPINQDALVYAARLAAEQSLIRSVARGRYAWLQMVRGELNVNSQTLHAGDAVATSDETELNIQATADSEFLLFDLA